MKVECPHCLTSKTDDDVNDPKQAVAQHMSQSKDHPEETYIEALNTLKTTDGAEGVESPENPAESESPDGDGAETVESAANSQDDAEGVEPTANQAAKGPNPSGENPLLHTPMTDGGEENDDDSTEVENECPDCGEEMRKPAADRRIEGRDRRGRRVALVTQGEESENWCPRCEIFKGDADGEMVVVR